MTKVITFGTFDILHEGHINILHRAKIYGDTLIVGVSSDEMNKSKGKLSVQDIFTRCTVIESLRDVDMVFVEESMDKKKEYIERYKADILVMGHDWEGKFDYLNDVCKVVYLPRTPGVSTTQYKKEIKSRTYCSTAEIS